MRRRLASAALVLATLAGCSTTVQGHAVGLSTTLRCAPRAVTGQGAPFCYVLPDGFTDNSALDTYGSGWTYRSLVSVAKYDLVEVLAARLRFDSDAYPDARLLDYARSQLAGVARVAQQTLTDVTPTSVAGVRAYQQTVRLPNRATERSIVAYRGHTEVYVQCLERDRPQAARVGCTRVLDTIQIIDLP